MKTKSALLGLQFFLLSILIVQDGDDSVSWQQRLPFSMNGQRPTGKRFQGAQGRKILETKWHGYLGLIGTHNITDWKAEDFFSDRGSIALLNAIVARDVDEMERLIDSDVDVNKQGKGGMNALYWSWYIDDDPRPFECLIRHGANPNVPVDETVGGPTLPMHQTKAVVNLVSSSEYNRLFELVFKKG